MWAKFSLRSRISLILAALVSVSIVGGLVMIWYTYRIEHILTTITEREFAAFQTAEALETSLINQKGYVTYFFLDNDPKWLQQLGNFRQIFEQKLQEVRFLSADQSQREVIERIAAEYRRYTNLKDQVIDYYKAGRRAEGFELHQEARNSFHRLLNLCEAYKGMHVQQVQKEARSSRQQAMTLRLVAGLTVLASLILAAVLAIIFVRQILVPLVELVRETGEHGEIQTAESENVVHKVSRKVHGLIADVDQTQLELKKSQEHLLQAEKMALVGKLAAGMAHSIRNPFTSVKMRLFSLNRSLALTDDQREDFQVISEEIRHIDTIVQNFLEFSRPPKLKTQVMSPSLVVDLALRLLSHRLKSYDVNVQVLRNGNLPEIQGDPEQLKEVLVNLLVNACEAMNRGGAIVIREGITKTGPATQAAVISVTDNGPGIPRNLQQKILQPFFTTKDDGTGLGLSIAVRILEEHGGKLTVESDPGQGATFCLTLQTKEADLEHDPDYR